MRAGIDVNCSKKTVEILGSGPSDLGFFSYNNALSSSN